MKTFLTIIITIVVTVSIPYIIESVKAIIDDSWYEVDLAATDEEKIQHTIDKFNKAYENGDFEGITKCMTEKTANMLNAEFGLTAKIFVKLLSFFTGGFLSFDSDILSDIWTLGAMSFGMKFETERIDIETDGTAKVYGKMCQYDKTNNTSGDVSCYIVMIQENNNWLIDNIFEY